MIRVIYYLQRIITSISSLTSIDHVIREGSLTRWWMRAGRINLDHKDQESKRLIVLSRHEYFSSLNACPSHINGAYKLAFRSKIQISRVKIHGSGHMSLSYSLRSHIALAPLLHGPSYFGSSRFKHILVRIALERRYQIKSHHNQYNSNSQCHHSSVGVYIVQAVYLSSRHQIMVLS